MVSVVVVAVVVVSVVVEVMVVVSVVVEVIVVNRINRRKSHIKSSTQMTYIKRRLQGN